MGALGHGHEIRLPNLRELGKAQLFRGPATVVGCQATATEAELL